MPRTFWIDTVMNDSVTEATQELKSLMSGVSSVDQRIGSWTLLRTIIGLDLGYLVHDSGEGSQVISCGIGVASQEAVIATVPDPQVATDFPVRGWIWRAQYRIFGFAADDPAVFTRRIDLDIRSRRKLDNGEAFFVADLESIEGAASTAQVVGMIRQLWMPSAG